MVVISIIRTDNLTKYYGKSLGISNLSFEISEGEIFGFIGPNGSGKSTTIRTLLNFIFPTFGSATIFGKDIIKNSQEIRMNIGYLPSEINYYDDMKVKDLFMYSAAFYKKNCMERIDNLAQRLELDLDRKIEDLSFGNRRKVGIIQALLHSPTLLILDEPSSGLDPLMQKVFFDLLKEEKQRGVTIFFSSHILGEVQRLCDRVGIIKNGNLIKVEKVDALIKNKFKKITITFENENYPQMIIDGIVNQEMNKNAINLLYNGDTKALVEKLSHIKFEDLLIEEPSLEEIFMNYYEKG